MADGPTFYAHLTFNAPLSERAGGEPCPASRRVEPHHCGRRRLRVGELLLRLAAATPAAEGTGIDTDPHLLERARIAASASARHTRSATTSSPPSWTSCGPAAVSSWASPAEWEAFESGFLADDEEWLLRHPDDAWGSRT